MNIHGITLTFFPKEIEYVRENFVSVIGKEYSVHQINTQSMVLYEYYFQQYNAPQVSFILYAPQSKPQTTVLYANIIDGYVRLIEYVAKQCGMKYYSITISDGKSKCMEAYHLHYYSKINVRNILCYRDPQWVFYEDGEPLEFENTELYKQRLKRKRFNKEIILKYVHYLGWDIMDERFWRTDNAVYEFIRTSQK